MRINLFAGAGAGKSTAAAMIYSMLKMRGYNVELVRELAKDWAYQQRNIGPYDEIVISTSQLHAEHFLLSHGVEHIVTDAPLLQGCFYAKKRGCPVWEHLVGIAKHFDSVHPSFNFFLNRAGVPYKPSGRFEDEEAARANDCEMRDFLATQGVNLTYVDSVRAANVVALFEDVMKPAKIVADKQTLLEVFGQPLPEGGEQLLAYAICNPQTTGLVSVDEPQVWIHYLDYTGNHEDYSVHGWAAARQEATNRVHLGLRFVTDCSTRERIAELMKGDDWLVGVRLYNSENACREEILFKEGGPVYG